MLASDPAAAPSVVSNYNQTAYRKYRILPGIIKYVWDKKYIIDLNGMT